MVTSKQTRLVGISFDSWLDALPFQWMPSQMESVRYAYVLGGESGGETSLAVADLLVDLGMGYEAVAAAFLYGPVAAGTLTFKALQGKFDPVVVGLVDGLIKLDTISDLHRDSEQADQQLESLRKLLLAMARDLRIVLMKLAFRLHTLRRTIEQYPVEEQRRIARETLDIFTPLANRLGIARIKWEMEDLALRVLEPVVYKRLAAALAQRRVDREHYITKVTEKLSTLLQKAHLHAEVKGRVKHIYSIWRKMQQKKLSFEQVFDVRAVRVIVDTVNDCYAALGVVHTQWNHIQQGFDDYIAQPKPNGYQSLHTAVIGPEGRVLEVQIRTVEMHRSAELGIAAHWHYKESGGSTARGDAVTQQIAWLRKMLERRDGDLDENNLPEHFKAEAFQDRVYVITPKGAIIDLPRGATPLDFAYHIHTEVGHRCRGAKVNGRIVPLSYALSNGERVEVLTAKQGEPSRDWLNPHLGYVASSRARAKIRQWFIQQDKENCIIAGRATLEREFQCLGIHNLKLEKVADKLGFARPEEMFAAIGRGVLSTGQVIDRTSEVLAASAITEGNLPMVRRTRTTDSGKHDIKIYGVGQLLTQMAQCCQPVPFEPIIGYITQGRGVTIHRQDCTNFLSLAMQSSDRVIDVGWGETPATCSVDIMILAYDRPGLLRDITAVLSNEEVNVLGVNTQTDQKTSIARMALKLKITDVVQLSQLLDKISQLHNVAEVYRQT
ncbi:MAG: GTP diphosphokinase [Candidatus Contendobacter odensis]|uniref:GTP pyrophosphokinase n=1 Tax=Candidatus Contendibacter odensensis TaxID=1400860 RepID=A0A2G6PFD3_9GAMM|nr:MAG: GTP diphosphokinase [Candidatus Contendobacter odensis]